RWCWWRSAGWCWRAPTAWTRPPTLASSRTCAPGRRPWALNRRAPSIPVRCRAGAARMVDARSRLKEVYAHPVGRDAIDKVLLQLGRSRRWVRNPVVANLPLGTLARLARPLLGDGFVRSLVTVLADHDDGAGHLPQVGAPAQQACDGATSPGTVMLTGEW